MLRVKSLNYSDFKITVQKQLALLILSSLIFVSANSAYAENVQKDKSVVSPSNFHLLLDRNRDKSISFEGLDKPEHDDKAEQPHKAYITWVNKDYDAPSYPSAKPSDQPDDSKNTKVESADDLKDLSALAVVMKPYTDKVLSDKAFKLKIRTQGISINLFKKGWTGSNVILSGHDGMTLVKSLSPSENYTEVPNAKSLIEKDGETGVLRLAFEVTSAIDTDKVADCIRKPDDCFIEAVLQDSKNKTVSSSKAHINFLPIKLSYKLPHEEKPTDTNERYLAGGFDDDASAQNRVPTFRSLPGVRIKLEYQFAASASGTSIEWDIPNGKICVDFNVLSSTCSDTNTKITTNPVYWEPDWTLKNLTTNAKAKVDYKLGSFECKGKKCLHDFKIRKRELKPIVTNNKPMRGTDVAMLEEMLWQLGNTASFATSTYKNYGYLSRRIAEDKRGIFEPQCPSIYAACRAVAPVEVTETNRYETSMARLVWGFKNANEINGEYDSPDDFTPENNNVTTQVLNVLEEQWNDYNIAYSAFNTSPTITHDHTVNGSNIYNDDDEETTDDWASHAVQSWDTTYNEDRLASIRTLVNVNTLTREMLIEAWARKEAGQGHWGGTEDDYRIITGAADSKMSLGFSQIQSRYAYGAVSTSCNEIRALNMMHPRDNLSGFVVWTANDDGCGQSFHEAFSDDSYAESFDNPGNIQLLRARYGTNEQTLLLQADNSVEDFDETDYERLTKGIAGYNQGFSVTYWGVQTLASSLRVLDQVDYSGSNEIKKCEAYPDGSNANKRCIGYLYAIDVKERANIPLASYLWRTQVMMDIDGKMQSVDVCFWYGEAEWEEHSWETERDQKINDNDYTCPVVAAP